MATPKLPMRIARGLARFVIWLLVGLVVLFAIGMSCANLSVVRELLRTRINSSLAETFVGTLVIDRIDGIGIVSIGRVDAHMLDANRRRVINVQGLSVKSIWPRMLMNMLRKQPLEITLEAIGCDNASVTLIDDGNGTPTLARAFLPRKPAAPSSKPSTTSILLPNIRMRHLWVNGRHASFNAIDTDVLDVEGSLFVGPYGMHARLAHMTLKSRALPAHVDPTGTLVARIDLPSAPSEKPSIFADFDGLLLDSRATIHAQFKEGQISGHLAIPELTASALREQVPWLTLTEGTYLEFNVEGKIPDLDFSAIARNSAVQLALSGRAALKGSKNIAVELGLAKLNLGKIMAAPETKLSAHFSAKTNISQAGSLLGKYSANIDQGRVENAVTPPLEMSGTLHTDGAGHSQILGNLTIDEPGARARLAYQIRSNSEKQQVAEARLTVHLDNAPRASRLLGVTAQGTLSAMAKLNFSTSRILASAQLEVSPLSAASVRASRLRLSATAAGPLQAPEMSADAQVSDVTLGPRHFQNASVLASGNKDKWVIKAHLQGDQKQQIELGTTLSLRGRTELREPNIVVTAQNDNLTMRARSVGFRSGAVSLDHFELQGPGTLSADGIFSNQAATLTFKAVDLQIARLVRELGFESSLARGIVNAEGSITGQGRKLRGNVTGLAQDLDFKQFRGGIIGLNFTVRDGNVSGKLDATLGRSQVVAHLDDLEIPRAPLSRKSLLGIRGNVAVTGKFELDQLAPVLRSLGAPLEQAKGDVQLDLNLQSPRAGRAAQHLSLNLKTKQLKIIEQRSGRRNIETTVVAREAQPTSIEGMDVDLALELDAEQHEIRLNASVVDGSGVVAHLDFESKLPDLTTVNSLDDIKTLPIRAQLTVPERSLERLPRVIRPLGMRGFIKADVTAEGTVFGPTLDGTFSVRDLKYRRRLRGFDASARINYGRQRGEMTAVAYSGAKQVGKLSSQWAGDLLGTLSSPQGQTPGRFGLDANLKLEDFPVGVVPALSDHSIRGLLSCDVSLRDLGKNARLQAKIDGSGLTVQDRGLTLLEVTAQTDDGRLIANLHAEQKPGSLHVDLSAPMRWGSRLAPLFNAEAKAHVVASQFQVDTLSPLLLPYVTELEGKLDADLNFELTEHVPQLKGHAQLRGGVFEVPQVGQRFTDVTANLSLAGETIRLESFEARGTTGRVTAQGQAAVSGTDLQSVKAGVDIKNKEKLPITFEGVAMGDAWGHLDISYAHSRTAEEVRVDVPDFHVQLPDEPMTNVQSLASDDHVQVGVYRQDGKFAAIPVQPLASKGDEQSQASKPLRAQVHLGSVWVERPQQAKVQLGGDLTITSGEPTHIQGRIELRGGTLDVNGKTFDIEAGSVAFTGEDSSNPTITATARWDSPAGYTVYAEYAGTVKKGKLTLHSEPQLTQNEIVSLLLFGSPEGGLNANDGGGGAAATAVGVAGDSAVKGFNRVMNDFTHLDVSARIDTSTGSARPELVVQVTPRLTTRVSRALGEPAPGESPDRTFLTMELRLKKAWALSAVVGDRGASELDLIWRKRY